MSRMEPDTGWVSCCNCECLGCVDVDTDQLVTGTCEPCEDGECWCEEYDDLLESDPDHDDE